MTDLFRREVIESRQSQWLGRIQLIRPVSLGLATALVVSAAIAVVGYLMLGEYTRKARVTGVLVPDRGVIRLSAPQSGTVLESRVREGGEVRAGDVLYVLAADTQDVAIDVAQTVAARQRSLQEASRQQSALERERLAAVARQIDAVRGELLQIDAEARLQAERLVLARQALSRLEKLRDENFISAAQVQTKAEEVIGLQAQGQALQRQRAGQLREIERLEAQRREVPLESQARQGEIERDSAELAQTAAEAAARQRVVIRAPQDGVVTAVLAMPGQPVAPASVLATLLPADARLQAHLFAPSSAVGFVHADQAVQMRYQAFPYQKFGLQPGQVLQVSRAPLQATELAGVPLPQGAAAGEPLYRITVALNRQSVEAYGRAQPLAPGMQLEADVLLERRRLIEWIFEPLVGLAGRV